MYKRFHVCLLRHGRDGTFISLSLFESNFVIPAFKNSANRGDITEPYSFKRTD